MRVCGMCWDADTLLLVNHRGLYAHDFWAPPGGGIQFGQSLETNLVREFKEETGLDVQVQRFQFACEFISGPLHAIELFFNVTITGGKLTVGTDPEMGERGQIINDVKFLSEIELAALPELSKHGLFRLAKNNEKIKNLEGYWRI